MPAHRSNRSVAPIVLAAAAVAALSFVLSSSAATPAVPLLGTTSLLTNVDSKPAGQGEAFRTTSGSGGTLVGLRVYVDASASAGPLTAGLYSDAAGHPGKLLASGSLPARTVGDWYTVPFVASVSVTGGGTYWIAILG